MERKFLDSGAFSIAIKESHHLKHAPHFLDRPHKYHKSAQRQRSKSEGGIIQEDWTPTHWHNADLTSYYTLQQPSNNH